MKIFWRLLAILVLGLIIESCRSTKKLQTVIAKRDSIPVPKIDSTVDRRADSMRVLNEIAAGIRKNHIDFKTFSAKIKVDFQGKDGKKNDFNAFVRLYKDSIMWVSINAALGIEAFRVLITRDSVKVLNKIDKIYQPRAVSYLQQVASLPFNFDQLQDVMVGNPIYLDSSFSSYRKEANGLTVVTLGELFKHFLTVSNGNYLPQQSKLDDVNPGRARTCYISYGNYTVKNGVNFSTFRKITVAEKSKLDIEMDYKQFDFNIELNTPFSVPKNYKVR